MTDRPRPPGQPLRAFLDGLVGDHREALLAHLAVGVSNGHHAAQCVTGAGAAPCETTLQLAAYLSTAIRELEAARAIVTGQMEGGGVGR